MSSASESGRGVKLGVESLVCRAEEVDGALCFRLDPEARGSQQQEEQGLCVFLMDGRAYLGFTGCSRGPRSPAGRRGVL
jgi:hypothetical protein